ncbi:hypothetical protein GW916_13060, partial [bacterium]|nr:hypothetical protein [bacterium]
MKISKIKKNRKSGAVTLGPWSPEVTVLNIEEMRKKSINPDSIHFEPILFDYHTRLKSGFYNNPKTYRYAKSYNQFLNRYLPQTSKTPGGVAAWMKQSNNAEKMMNMRFGSHGAVGYSDPVSKDAMLSVTGVFAFTTSPHAAHNEYLSGEIGSRTESFRVNVSQVWKEISKLGTKKKEIDISFNQKFISWIHLLDSQLANQCIPQIRSRIKNIDAVDAYMAQVAKPFFSPNLKKSQKFLSAFLENRRLSQENSFMTQRDDVRPKSFNELLRFFQMSRIDYRTLLKDINGNRPISKKIHSQIWREAIVRAVSQPKVYSDLSISKIAGAQRFYNNRVARRSVWTSRDVDDSVRALQLRGKAAATLVGIYAYLLNTQLNVVSREFHKGSGLRDDASHLISFLRRKTRVGPGNAVFMPSQRRLLFLMPGLHFTLGLRGSKVDCSLNDSNVNGSERAAAVLGSISGKDHLLMTLRQGVDMLPANAKATDTFNLASWTRGFSYSSDSSQTWSRNFTFAPVFQNFTKKFSNTDRGRFLVSKSDRFSVVKEGFESSMVHAGITAVPNFFGRNKPLILHLHPQASYRAIKEVKKDKFKIVTCLGENGGDASKEGLSRCDYRFNMTLVPAVLGSSMELIGSRGHNRTQIDWLFEKKLNLRTKSGGYSALAVYGENPCSAYVAAAFEGPKKDKAIYRGFNDGVVVHLIQAQQMIKSCL